MQSEELDFQVTRPYVSMSVVLTSLCAEYCFEMALDFNGDVNNHNVQHVMEELKKTTSNMLVLDQREVPWFPVHISELDGIANRTLDLGTDLSADHPGAHDAEYRKRRMTLAELANRHKVGREIPRIDYTPQEVATWGAVYRKLQPLMHKHACREYLDIVEDMGHVCGFQHDNIPQQVSFRRLTRAI